MRGGIRQGADQKLRGASWIRRKRRPEGESRVVWMSGEHDVMSGCKECCNASQDAQDTWDAEYPTFASGHNARRSDAGSLFAHEFSQPSMIVK